MPKITKRVVDALTKGPHDYFLWDEDLPGFGVRVWPAGRKVFVAQYRAGGRTRRLKIGAYGPLTVDEARRQARIALGDVARGGDPAEDRATHRKSMTVRELCVAYLADAEKGLIGGKGNQPKKASTLSIDRGRIDRHIIPLLGPKRVRDVARTDIVRFIRDVTIGKTAAIMKTGKPRGKAIVEGGSGTAARTAGLLGGILTYALNHGVIDANPSTGVKRPAGTPRDRRLSDAEYKRLGDALVSGLACREVPQLVYSIILLALTGCRLGEITRLTWAEVDFDDMALRLKDSKEGKSIRPLGKAAVKLLATVSRENGAKFVFPGARSGKTYAGVARGWKRIAKVAGLEDATPHTLRHTFASVAAELGYSELTISAMLGHAAGSITSRYVHQLDEVLSIATTRVAASIADRMGVSDLSA